MYRHTDGSGGTEFPFIYGEKGFIYVSFFSGKCMHEDVVRVLLRFYA